MLNKVAIIVPTKNNLNLIDFLLNHYNNQNFSGTVYLADSSDKDVFLLTKKLIKRNNFSFKIVHKNTYGKRVALSIMTLKNVVKENYCVQTGDDDYLFLSGLDKCLKELKLSKDIISCAGRGYLLTKKNKFDQYSMGSVMSNNYKSRALDYINNGYCLQWGLIKKNIFFKIWDNKKFNNYNYIGSDFLPSLKLCLYGKIQYVNSLYVIHKHNPINEIFANKIKKDFLSMNDQYFKEANNILNEVLKKNNTNDKYIFEYFFLNQLSKKLSYISNKVPNKITRRILLKIKYFSFYIFDYSVLNNFVKKIKNLES